MRDKNMTFINRLSIYRYRKNKKKSHFGGRSSRQMRGTRNVFDSCVGPIRTPVSDDTFKCQSANNPVFYSLSHICVSFFTDAWTSR